MNENSWDLVTIRQARHAGIMPPYPQMFPQILSLLRFLTFYPKTFYPKSKLPNEHGARAGHPSFPHRALLPADAEDTYKLQVCGSSQPGPSSFWQQ